MPCCVQTAEYRFLSSLNVLNVVQSGIMFLGISLGVMACTAGVAKVSSGLKQQANNIANVVLRCVDGPEAGSVAKACGCTFRLHHVTAATVFLSPICRCCCLLLQGALTVGDTVLFLTLMAQLYGPLSESLATPFESAAVLVGTSVVAALIAKCNGG